METDSPKEATLSAQAKTCFKAQRRQWHSEKHMSLREAVMPFLSYVLACTSQLRTLKMMA